MERVLLTTGGTGGHIFPALAVAEALRQRHPGVELLFVGSQYGPEQRLARAAGIDFIGLPVRGFIVNRLHVNENVVRVVGAAALVALTGVSISYIAVNGYNPFIYFNF